MVASTTTVTLGLLGLWHGTELCAGDTVSSTAAKRDQRKWKAVEFQPVLKLFASSHKVMGNPME